MVCWKCGSYNLVEVIWHDGTVDTDIMICDDCGAENYISPMPLSLEVEDTDSVDLVVEIGKIKKKPLQ